MPCSRPTFWMPVLLGLICCGCAAQVMAQPPTTAPTMPGDHKLRYQAVIAGRKVDMVYIVRLPKDYDKTTDLRPVLVFTHGAGECGVDGAALYVHGPLAELDKPENKTLSDSFPFILIAPQCPPRGERWEQEPMYKAVVGILDEILPKLRADKDRVYLTGISMGGKGAWLAGIAGADRFAAICPMASYGDYAADQIQKLKHTGVWMIAGTEDSFAIKMDDKMLAFMKDDAAFVRNTIVPGADHIVWGPFYSSAQFYETLLGLKRPSAAEKKQGEAEPPFLARPSPPVPTTAGRYHRSSPTMIKGQAAVLDYSLFVPKGYQPEGTPTPLIVYLHPYKVIGPRVGDVCVHGIDAELEKKGNESFKDSFPAIVYAPTCPAGMGSWDDPWTQKAVVDVLDELTKTMNVDRTRVYLTGETEGGAGTWQLALAAPDRFAAIAPVAVTESYAVPADAPARLKDVAILSPGEIPGDPTKLYSNPAFYDWLMKQKKH